MLGEEQDSYGLDIAGLAKDPVTLQKYLKYDHNHYGYVNAAFQVGFNYLNG